jgi:hypothetical protein
MRDEPAQALPPLTRCLRRRAFVPATTDPRER